MTEWIEKQLGEVVRLQRGHDLTEAQRSPGQVPVVGSAGPNGWHNRARAPGPGVTIGRSGASVGVVTYVPTEYWPHNTVLYVTDFLGNDPRFIAYLLRTLPFTQRNSGAAQPSLNRNYLYTLRVPTPSPSTQSRVSAMLGAYDDLIEINRRRIVLSEDMARSLFDEWFVHFRFPSHDSIELCQTVEGQVPEGWRLGMLSDIASQVGRSISPSASPDSIFAHYSIPAYDEGQSPVEECGSVIMSNKTLFEPPVVLVSKLNPRIARVWNVADSVQSRAVCSGEFIPLAATPPFTSSLLYAIATRNDFSERLRSMAGGTSTSHQRVRPADILSSPIAIPPAELVETANQLIEPACLTSAILRQANRRLAQARDLLLPRLISGELTLPDAVRELDDAGKAPELVAAE